MADDHASPVNEATQNGSAARDEEESPECAEPQLIGIAGHTVLVGAAFRAEPQVVYALQLSVLRELENGRGEVDGQLGALGKCLNPHLTTCTNAISCRSSQP